MALEGKEFTDALEEAGVKIVVAHLQELYPSALSPEDFVEYVKADGLNVVCHEDLIDYYKKDKKIDRERYFAYTNGGVIACTVDKL